MSVSRWSRRKKYSVEGEPEGKKIPMRVSKLVKRELYLTMASIVGVSLVIIGSTYAVFSSVNRSKEYNVINVGTLQIEYDDTGSGLGDIIKLNNAFPVSDSTGQSNTPYKFKITNTGSIATNYSIRIADDEGMIEADGCSNNLLPKTALKYSLNGGTATLLSSKSNYVIESGTLRAGESKTYNLRMWIHTNVGNEILGKHFHGKIVIESEATEPILAKNTILANNTIQTGTPDFSTTSGTGLYQAEDDDGTSYYFRGNVTNNWVKFAADGDEWLYWRIIRINGDGTIRLLYNGKTTTTTGEGTTIGQYYMSSSGFQEKYMGYTYDRSSDETDSGLKQKIDAWYADTVGSVNTDYDQYVATGKFCNDTSGGTTSGNVKSYASVTRMNNHTPSLKCPQTTEDYGGSYLLKAGTVTLDEMVMAGATSTANSNYYMYNGLNYGTWTMTPGKVDSSSSTKIPYYWQQQPNGSISNVNSYASSIWVRPVINLRADVQLTGTGTASDPYEIVES